MSIATKRSYLKQKYVAYLDKDQFLQAGLQFMDMAKDVLDTFNPYKSKTHLKRDLLQTLYGLCNLCLAVLLIALWVPFLVFQPIYNLCTMGYQTTLLRVYLYAVAGSLANAAALVIRGISQVITAPLTWLRAIGRGLYTAINGWQAFNDNEGLQRLVAEGKALVIKPEGNDPVNKPEPGSQVTSREIFYELHGKMHKALRRGQPVFIDPVVFFSTYKNFCSANLTTTENLSENGKQAFAAHLRLFESSPAKSGQNANAKMMTLEDLEKTLRP